MRIVCCYINDIDISAVNSKIGDINFSQQCGGQPLCSKSAPVAGAPPIQVDCDTGAVVATSSSNNKTSPTRTLYIVLAVLGGLILLLILIASAQKPKEIEPPIFIPGVPAKERRPMLGRVEPRARPMLQKTSRK
jgi:hypothetical protein